MGVLFNGNGLRPTFIVSALIILTCLTRWGIKGIIGAPILAVATWIGGRYFIHSKINPYDWKMLVSMVVGNCSISLICFIFKKYKTNEVMKNGSRVALVALCSCIFLTLVEIMCLLVLSKFNTYYFNLVFYNIPGYVVTTIIAVALYSQGIMKNYKEKIISERKQAEADAEYEKKFFEELDKEEQEQKDL